MPPGTQETDNLENYGTLLAHIIHRGGQMGAKLLGPSSLA